MYFWLPAVLFLLKFRPVDGQQEKEERVQVRLSTGVVEGRVVTFGDKKAYAFMGVPYAEPPIGDLRFRPTRLKNSWSGIWDATHYGPPCAQRTLTTVQPLANSSEDCLHVNIYADPRCMNKSCSIFFYVHGGGFFFDAPTMFNETLLMQNFAIHRNIFVMPAYRLGIFGFLDSDRDAPSETPENAGILVLNLITALRWTQFEIQRFGGDPRRMTVIGNSAGAHLAFILLQSPLVEPTAFQSAIISSGMIGIRRNSNAKLTQLIVEKLGCFHSSSTFQEKIACLREKTTDQLLDAMSDTEKEWVDMAPQPDSYVLSEYSVKEFLQNWRGLPLMLLTTRDEFFMQIKPTVEGKCERLVENFGYDSPRAVDTCIKYYTSVSNLNYTTRDAYHAFMHRLAAINTRQGYPTFTGLFAQPHGLRHAGDLKYLLGLHPIKDGDKDEDDRKMDEYYPMILREFVHKGPKGMQALDWLPTDEYGRSFFWLRFEQGLNSSAPIDWPHMIEGEFFRPKETNFWMETLKEANEHYGHVENKEEKSWEHWGVESLPPPLPPKPHEQEPSVWIAFWLLLGICAILVAVLSVIIFYWISARLKALNLVFETKNGQQQEV